LVVEAGDAVEMERLLLVHHMSAPEVIVSGIPFSSLDPKTARAILKTIHRDLADGGTFIAYQLRGHVADYAEEFFGRPQSVQWVWWNLPPLRVYTWRKS
jgi:phospholipid N-methyltransferase